LVIIALLALTKKAASVAVGQPSSVPIFPAGLRPLPSPNPRMEGIRKRYVPYEFPSLDKSVHEMESTPTAVTVPPSPSWDISLPIRTDRPPFELIPGGD
jgi:hypothetical protein